jgi:hypothetical protein
MNVKRNNLEMCMSVCERYNNNQSVVFSNPLNVRCKVSWSYSLIILQAKDFLIFDDISS